MRLLATNGMWSLLSHLLSRGSLMLASIVLARALSTADFAAYSYFQLTVSLLAAYAAMGLGVTASRFFAEVGHERGDRAPPPLFTLWFLSLLLGVLASVAVFLLPDQWLSAGLAVPRWMLSLGVLALAAGVVPSGAIIGLEKYRQASIVSAACGITMLVGAWLAADSHSAEAAMGALLLAYAIQTIGESILTIRAVGARRLISDPRIHREHLKRVLSFAGPMLVVSLLSVSGAWLLGRLILQGKGGESAFALYAIGLQWFALTLLLPGMLSRVIFPRLVRGGNASSQVTRTLVRRGAWIAMVIAAVMTVAGILLGPALLWIYGSQYNAGRWYIGAFMAAAILSAPANVIGNAIVVNEGQKRWLALTSAWFVTLLIAGLAFSSAGAWSGALAQAIAAAVLTLLSVKAARTRRLI